MKSRGILQKHGGRGKIHLEVRVRSINWESGGEGRGGDWIFWKNN